MYIYMREILTVQLSFVLTWSMMCCGHQANKLAKKVWQIYDLLLLTPSDFTYKLTLTCYLLLNLMLTLDHQLLPTYIWRSKCHLPEKIPEAPPKSAASLIIVFIL